MNVSRRRILSWFFLPAAVRGAPERVVTAEYRAKATVLLFSLPLFHRANVGTGYLRVGEREEGEKRHLRLEFGAGSLPEKAAGLNRLGIFEETVVERSNRVESAEYAGFMTTSKEKDLNEAKSALASGDALTFTAVRGSIKGGVFSSRLLRVTGLPAKTWVNRDELKSHVLSRLAESGGEGRQNAPLGGEPCSPFLYAVREAMRTTAANDTRRFAHNGKIHRLRTKKSQARQGEMEMEGKIDDEKGAELSSFKLWFAADKPQAGPLRFEFRPRSFLRLRFERV
ncbi:MAG: hypothetical protein ACKV2U_29515 [Bryobacteraceae bacterium]